MKSNINAVKEEYFSRGCSLKEAAEKYGVPYETVRRRASSEKWRTMRNGNACNDVLYDRQLAVLSDLMGIAEKAVDVMKSNHEVDIIMFGETCSIVKDIITLQHEVVARKQGENRD